MLAAHATLKLVRIDASVVIFLSILVPVLSRTGSIAASIAKAAPMFFIGICTWIANDLDDVERDYVNHPDRPLPSGAITPAAAAGVYFVFLAAALLATRYYVEPNVSFWYYLVLTLSLSYGYIVDFFPSFKAPYVASAMAIPVLIAAIRYPAEEQLSRIAASVFCFALGKELCMDLLDRPGDTRSRLHRIDARLVAAVAFILQAVGLFLVFLQPNASIDMLYSLAMSGLLAAAAALWFVFQRQRTAVALLRLELLAGLYFLI